MLYITTPSINDNSLSIPWNIKNESFILYSKFPIILSLKFLNSDNFLNVGINSFKYLDELSNAKKLDYSIEIT